MIVLAHVLHTIGEPVLLFAVPATIVGVWEWRSRRRRPVPFRVRSRDHR